MPLHDSFVDEVLKPISDKVIHNLEALESSNKAIISLFNDPKSSSTGIY